MSNILIGIIFCSFDFSVNLGDFSLGLMPDFLGFYFIMKGLRQLSHYSDFFEKALPFSQAMAVYSAVIYTLDFFKISDAIGIFRDVCILAGTVLYLLILYLITEGVKELDEQCEYDLNSRQLSLAWCALAICKGVAIITFFIPFLQILPLVAAALLSVWYLVCLYQTSKTLRLFANDRE